MHGKGGWLALALLAFTLVLAGCEAAASERLTLPEIEVSFRFEVSGNALTDGQPYTATSVNTVDLMTALQQRGGYTKNEVVAATVTAAEIERVQPALTDLSELLSEARVLLTASGLSDLEVASRTGFPDDETASMAPRSGADITAFVKKPAFGAKLRLVPLQPDAGETYVYEVRLTLRVQVEGV
ncbi:hypothetical protein [Rhodothermus marinus]|uniref:hypothetical protein n=1 Tax=Rhodothermus marinus TaxID=29549 RepID=UPI0012BA3EDC|nr:hypothetical protein [Rhodothermus marinus]BBM71977.1 hypothetical protein RmaAA338_08420 [Rhodothermus marinus]